MNDKPKDELPRLAEFPELFGMLYGDYVNVNKAKHLAEQLKRSRVLTTLALSIQPTTLTGRLRSMGLDGAPMHMIDYPLVLDTSKFKDLKVDMDHVMQVLKGRAADKGVTYKIDSMSQLEDVVIDLKRSGDPCWPLPEQQRVGVAGFKLKPNATSMYHMFVERNNKRR